MSRHAQENIVIVLVIGFFAAVLLTSLGFGPRARLVPIPIAALGIILGIVQLIWQNLQSADELHIDLLEFLKKNNEGSDLRESVEDQEAAETKAVASKDSDGRIVRALGMVVGFVGLILLIGPMPSIFIFTAAYFILSKHYTWPRSLVYAAMFVIAVYLLFVVGLELQLYHGIIQPVLDWYYEKF